MAVKSGFGSWEDENSLNIKDLPSIPHPGAGARQGAGAWRVKCGPVSAGAAGAAGLIGLDWHKQKRLERKNVL
jgi:hypothetical protein